MGGGDIVMNKEMVHSDIWTGVIYLVFVSSAPAPGNKPPVLAWSSHQRREAAEVENICFLLMFQQIFIFLSRT